MKKLTTVLVGLGLLAAIAYAAYWFSPYEIKVVDMAATAVMQPGPTARPPTPVIPGPIAIGRMQSMMQMSNNLEIITFETQGTVMVSQDNPAWAILGIELYKPGATEVELFSVGFAHAGVEWSGISSTVSDAGALIVILPEPKVFYWQADWNPDDANGAVSYFVDFDMPIDWKGISVGAPTNETMNYVNGLAEKEGVRLACNAGVLQAVNDRARERFLQMLGTISYTNDETGEEYAQYNDVLTHVTPPGDCQP